MNEKNKININIFTAKEKAKLMINEYLIYFPEFYSDKEYGYNDYKAKQCALIAVQEILNAIYDIPFGNALNNELEYWEEVKQEIENL